MSIRNIAENIKKRGLKDVLDPDVWRTYSDYKDIEDAGLTIPAEELQAYAEQLTYRLSKCSKCVDAGKCVGYDTSGCSCEMPIKALVPNAKCSEGRWGKMEKHDVWNKEKVERNLQIVIVEP